MDVLNEPPSIGGICLPLSPDVEIFLSTSKAKMSTPGNSASRPTRAGRIRIAAAIDRIERAAFAYRQDAANGNDSTLKRVSA